MLTDGSECRINVVPDRERVIIAPIGEIDLGNFEVMTQALADLRDSGFTNVVVDLRGVRFMDSTGLHVLWEEHVRAKSNEESFAIIDGPGAVRRLLQLTGLSLRLDRADPSPKPVSHAGSEPRLADPGRFNRAREAYLRSLERVTDGEPGR